jgi:endonuclease/exonuclease/phosphatase family metal-dependent hydrolase
MENHRSALSDTASGLPAVAGILALGLLFLFFFELLADFVAAIYAFGLLSVSLTADIASALLLLAPITLIFWRKEISNQFLAFGGLWVLFCRAIEILLATRGKMYISGLGVAGFMIFLPALLSSRRRESGNSDLGFGLILGVSLSILLRALGSGTDLSAVGMFRIFSWGLALLGGMCLLFALKQGDRPASPSSPLGAASAWKIMGMALGVAAAIVLLYFAFTSPTVIARWTGGSYLLVSILLMLALVGLGAVLSFRPVLIGRLTPAGLLVWNTLFVLSLTLTILAHQARFPITPTGYPFSFDPLPFGDVFLAAMLLLSPVVLVDFILLCREIVKAGPSIRLLGGSFAVGGLFILLMIFAQVFTTVYDYIPVVGPLFRDRFWLVFLIDGVIMTLSVLLVRSDSSRWDRRSGRAVLPAVSLAVIAVGAVAAAWFTTARPPTSTGAATVLRVLTYNIQQGYSRDGQANFDGQLALIRQQDPDIIGLQECDTARIAGGNTDVVRYFADHLGMYSYYGPDTVAGTFGVALLSKTPIQHPRTFYLYSQGEQTAVIEAQVSQGERTFNVYVTHLGNDGPITQQEQALALSRWKDNVLLMGDFNFRPDTEQYRQVTSVLADAWLLANPQSVPSVAFGPDGRIDYLYISPGTKVIQAQYLVGAQSDHPAFVVDIGP